MGLEDEFRGEGQVLGEEWGGRAWSWQGRKHWLWYLLLGEQPLCAVLSPETPPLIHSSGQVLWSLFLPEEAKSRPQLPSTGHGWRARPFPDVT